MSALIGELGKKLAERWLSLLVLPGALYLAAAIVTRTLGNAHALDTDRLIAQITTWATAPAATTIGGQAVILAAILPAAAAIGLAAQALGTAIERLILAAGWRTWPKPQRDLVGWLVTYRHKRWTRKLEAYQQLRRQAAIARTRDERDEPAARHQARRALERISLTEPDRPTWSGDRIQAAVLRLDHDLHLDLPTVWPHLWLLLPENTRKEITTARQSLTRATTLAGWAFLYLPLGARWWPALPISAILAAIARHGTRTATDAYATLIEAAARLHTNTLATHLNLDHTGPPNPDLGATLTDLLHVDSPQGAAPLPHPFGHSPDCHTRAPGEPSIKSQPD